jgi:ribosomal protein L37E
VCRVCGELRVHGSEERCPHCGRWSTSFERVRPVYWLRETTPAESVARLGDNLAAVEAICAEADPSDMRRAGPDGGWSAHQVVEHLHNAQAVFRGRIDQLLAGGEPELRSVQVWAMAPGEVPTSELIDSYRTLRLEVIQMLGSADHTAWDNRGYHEEWGWVTLAEQASYFANHEPTHLAQLADALGGHH